MEFKCDMCGRCFPLDKREIVEVPINRDLVDLGVEDTGSGTVMLCPLCANLLRQVS